MKLIAKIEPKKIILCHTNLNKNIFSNKDWDIVNTYNRVAFSKAVPAQQLTPPSVSKPKSTKPISWSVKLMQDNPGSRWITFRGNKVLIRGNADGTATVVYSGNPAHEHLRIVPKTHEDYSKIKKEADKKDIPKPELEEKGIQELQRERAKISREIGKKHEAKIIDILKDKQYIPKEMEDIAQGKVIGEIEKIANKQIKSPHRPDKKHVDFDFQKFADKLEKKDKKDKQEIIDELTEHAKNQVIENNVDSVVDTDLKIKSKKIKSKNPLLNNLVLDHDTAIEITGISQAAKEARKEATKELKVAIKAKKNDITGLSGIGISDYQIEAGNPKDITEKVLKEHENKVRAQKNTQFYNNFENKLEKNSKQLPREVMKGAQTELHAMSHLILDGKGLNNEMIDFLGIGNATKVLAGTIEKNKDIGKIEGDLESLLQKKSQKIVKETLVDFERKNDIINGYKKQSRDIYDKKGNLVSAKMLASATANANIARLGMAQNKELGNAVGSLQTGATLLENIKTIKDEKTGIEIDGGKSKRSLDHKLKKFGIRDISIVTRDNEGRFKVKIPYQDFHKIMTNTKTTSNIDEQVRRIKSGEIVKGGKAGLAGGQPENFVDWMPKKDFDKIQDRINKIEQQKSEGTKLSKEDMGFLDRYAGYKPYKNTKGEPGFTSNYKEGTVLYGKQMDARLLPHQQKAVAMANNQKRFVMDFGAGTGKTIAHLAIISDLKSKGKLINPAVISPPSRLVKEFFKDQEKFFPGLNVLNLDEIKGGIEAKKKAVLSAKEKGYDLIMSGHDSIKSGIQMNENPDSYADKMMQKLGKAINTSPLARNSEQKELVSKYKNVYAKKGGLQKVREIFKDELANNKGLPETLASIKPYYLGVDEAHEVWGEKTASKKSEALKKLADNAEYFVPSTGTLMRAGIGDFAHMMHITRPDLVPSAENFKGKWGQGVSGNLTEGVANNEMAKEVDSGILTHKSDIIPKVVKNIDDPGHKKIDLSLNQQVQYARNEDLYRQDRDYNKNNNLKRSFGVWDNEKNQLITDASGKIKDVEHLRDHPDLVVSEKAKPTKAAMNELKKAGYKNTDRYSLRELGKTGAGARRDSMHDVVINNGNPEYNSKVQSMLKDMDENPDANHGAFYTNKKSKKTITDALLKRGYSIGDIAFIDADNNRKQNNQQLADYMSGKKKILVGSMVAQTGLNIQKMDRIHHIGVPKTYNLEQQAQARSWRKGREKYATENNPNADVHILHHETNTVIDNNARANIKKQGKEAAKIKGYREKYGLKEEAEVIKKSIKPIFIIKAVRPSGQDKVARVMREFKEGKLKSSSGKLVTSRKQAIAIAMSEAGLAKSFHVMTDKFDKWDKKNPPSKKNVVNMIIKLYGDLIGKENAIEFAGWFYDDMLRRSTIKKGLHQKFVAQKKSNIIDGWDVSNIHRTDENDKRLPMQIDWDRVKVIKSGMNLDRFKPLALEFLSKLKGTKGDKKKIKNLIDHYGVSTTVWKSLLAAIKPKV